MRFTHRNLTDDYFPDNGDLTYNVRSYDLSIDYKPSSNQLTGRAVIEAEAVTDLNEFSLDLRGLQALRLNVDIVGVQRFWHMHGKLHVRTTEEIGAGELFRVTVRYNGKPSPIRDGGDGMGWEELADGVIVAGQTNGAPSWFPCNDRPANKATYRIAITAPSAYEVVSNGALMSRHRGASTTTSVFEQEQPMATYLATVQIGQYVTRTSSAATVPLTYVLPARCVADYKLAFGKQAEMMDFFIDSFGPYPFDSYTVVITDDELDIPLESQGLSTFGSNMLADDWNSERLVAHELAHQWFGNSLTVGDWRDIWLHEGFACYCEWLWSEESGIRSTDERAENHWHRLAERSRHLKLSDPGPEHMFDDWVYKRGALLLHALRLTVGDDTFFEILREWVERNSYGSVTTAMFIELAGEISGENLKSFFNSWLNQADLPELPA